jgi:hypothetical protein
MKLQTSVISIVIIAGLVLALVSASYIWAIPYIEKRSAITDYYLAENFMLDLDSEIREIAKTGSGEVTLSIPIGRLYVNGQEDISPGQPDPLNNTISLKFQTSQPVVLPGQAVPIRTTYLDYIGDQRFALPRIITIYGFNDPDPQINMSIRYRELRSDIPNGYVIGLCTPSATGCDAPQSGNKRIVIRYDGTIVKARTAAEGGPLNVVKVGVQVF